MAPKAGRYCPCSHSTTISKRHPTLLWPKPTIEDGYCDVNALPTFSNKAHGFLGVDCRGQTTTVLLATNDGGRTWKPNRQLTNFPGSCNAPTVVDSVWLVPVKRNGHIALLHIETGATVDAKEDNYPDCESSMLSFISPAQGWMLKNIEDNATLQSTTDGGRTWQTISPPACNAPHIARQRLEGPETRIACSLHWLRGSSLRNSAARGRTSRSICSASSS